MSALLDSVPEVALDYYVMVPYYYVMVPSCAPASRFESSGATVTAEDVRAFLRERPDAIGLAEVMDFLGVVAGNPGMLAKLSAALEAGRHLDGHAPRLSAPGLTGPPLDAYLATGIGGDHEGTHVGEALEKAIGMWIMVSEGSAAGQNLEALLPVVLEHGPRNTILCTDDREPDGLLRDGHVDEVVRKAIRLGGDPVDAIVMATINTARWQRAATSARPRLGTSRISSRCRMFGISARRWCGSGDDSWRATDRPSRSPRAAPRSGCGAACGSRFFLRRISALRSAGPCRRARMVERARHRRPRLRPGEGRRRTRGSRTGGYDTVRAGSAQVGENL